MHTLFTIQAIDAIAIMLASNAVVFVLAFALGRLPRRKKKPDSKPFVAYVPPLPNGYN